MEGVNHVDVVKVGSGSLVCYVDRVFQRKIPYGEGLKLGIASFDAALMLIVELAKAYSHLATAGAGCRNNHQRSGGFHIIVAPESFVGVDEGYVVWVAVDGVVIIGLDAESLQFLPIEFRRALAVVVGDYH